MTQPVVPAPAPVDPSTVGTAAPAPPPAAPPQTITIDHAQAADFLAGKVGLPAGARVHVKIGGKLGTVPTEDLQATLQRPDAVPASAQEVHDAELQRKFGDSVGMLQAGGAGLARGLTAGLSDPLITGAAGAIGGPEAERHARETLEGLQEANPGTSGVAEGVGAVAPLVVGDAAGLAGEGLRGAGAITRGIAGLGEFVGERSTSLIPEATSFLGKLAQGAVREGVNAGAQTALHNVGNQISEDTLGDTDTNGEKLWMAAGHGFLLGAAGGGLFGGAGVLGREALNRAAPKLSELAETQAWRTIAGRKAFQTMAEKIPGGDRAIGRVLLDDGIIAAGDRVEDIAPKVAQAREAAGQSVGELLDVADNASIGGVNVTEIERRARASLADLRRMPTTNRAAIAKYESLLDDLRSFAEKRTKYAAPDDVYGIGLAKSETTAPRATKAIGIEHRIEPFAIDPNAGLADSGEGGWRIGPDGTPVLHEGETKSPFVIDRTRPGHIGEGPMIDPKMVEGADIGPAGVGTRDAYDAGLKPGAFADEAGAVRKPIKIGKDVAESERIAMEARAKYDRDLTVTFREAQTFRKQLDDLIKWNTNPLAPVNETTEAMKGVRNAIEGALTDAGDKASAELGGSWKERYEAAKLKYRQLTVADRAAQDAVERFQANRRVSPTDYLIGAAGLAGALGGHGVASGGLHGLALAAAHHVVRERGNATAAALLDKLSAMGGIQKAITRVDRQIARGVSRVVDLRKASNIEEEEGVKSGIDWKPPSVSHEERVGSVLHAASNAEAHVGDIAAAVAPIEPHAPAIANAFQQAAVRATTLLATKLPPGHRPTPSITPQFDRTRATATDRAEFDRVSHLTHDPVGYTFSRIDSGTLTKSDVDAVKSLVPKTYTEMTTAVREKLTTLKKPLPYARQLQIETLLGVPDEGSAVGQILAQAISPAPSSPMPGPHGKTGAPPRQLKGVVDTVSLPGSTPMK